MRKILVSPGYGAGWTSWNDHEIAKIMIDYQPVIDFLESGGKFIETGTWSSKVRWEEPGATVLKEMCAYIEAQTGETYVCLLGARDLVVETVPGRVRINEYDGFESIEYENSYDEYL